VDKLQFLVLIIIIIMQRSTRHCVGHKDDDSQAPGLGAIVLRRDNVDRAIVEFRRRQSLITGSGGSASWHVGHLLDYIE